MNVEQLISEVFSRPALWDQKNKCYHNRVLVEKLWMSVASEMKIPSKGRLKKKKWKYLRDQFRCEVRKIPTPKSGDAASQITSSWPYFNSLLFLKDQMKFRNLSGNLKASSVKATQEEVVYEEEIEDILNTSQVEETRDLCDNDEFSCEVPSKKKNTSNSTAQLLEIEKRKLALLENKKMEKKTVLDEDEAFFVTLLPHIRKLDPENKFLCRMEMQNIRAFVFTNQRFF
ncbi:uncharacterized protein LOC128921648 [Zeugodacus cucurbitae]|uniref:uncharacterized protein LOC128921648 n=1 Tax=Zeugodacus cucurbitae TaxID=28588 RepID=UPI0023D9433F|nr:uncharacterized protein LOC128921648 [Zeugodacus cucurbitae]